MILLKERALSIEFLFIVALVALEFTLFPRFWCRMFCPTGAVLSVFRTNLTLRVHAVRNKTGAPCCKETACANACPMRLQPYRDGGDTLCTNCGLCVDACPHARMRFTGFCIGR
jgi:ferredoxin-type protein NapH